jgi:hypothetical protein
MRSVRIVGNGMTTGSCGLSAPEFRIVGREVEIRGNGCGIRSGSVRLTDAVIQDHRTDVASDRGSSVFGSIFAPGSCVPRSGSAGNQAGPITLTGSTAWGRNGWDADSCGALAAVATRNVPRQIQLL